MYPTNAYYVAVIKSNSEISKDTGIEIGIRNARKVDKYMRTSISNIFAAGDCATQEIL
jgi:pyruvate/2-oxoglutarate dehydrogenase complex dihydrolipoamide dehydrogenase (E3) component